MWFYYALMSFACNREVCIEARGGLSHPIVKRHTGCECTSVASCFSKGVDVRPRCGCQDFNQDGYHFCYTVVDCPGAFESTGFPGAAYRPCLGPPPPPPSPQACTDPWFPRQWHLDVSNVASAWSITRGKNAHVAVLDDGVQYHHPDLKVNASLSFGWDFETGVRTFTADDPMSQHGTATAGVIAAIPNNGRGGCGAAHASTLVAVKLLSNEASTSLSDDIFMKSLRELAKTPGLVASNSWGPPDDGRVDGPGHREWYRVANDAIREFCERGHVLVFASGNGGQYDNSNDDGFASHLDTVAVGSVGDDLHKTSYSEPGTNIDLVAPSDGGWRSITTTDVVGDAGYGPGNVTHSFGGTSASTPLVSGVVALMLSVRPELTPRDVRLILWSTSSKIDPQSADWITNAKGVATHPYYGHGMLNAAAAVAVANSWTHPPEVRDDCSSTWVGFLPTVYDRWTEIVYDGLSFEFEELEQVVVYVDVDHPWRGDVLLRLVSPSGTAVPFTFLVPSGIPLHHKAFVPHNFTINSFYKESSSTRGWKLQVMDVSSRGRLRQSYVCLHGVKSHSGGRVDEELGGSIAPVSPPPLHPPVDDNGSDNGRTLRVVIWTVSSISVCVGCLLLYVAYNPKPQNHGDPNHGGPAAKLSPKDRHLARRQS